MIRDTLSLISPAMATEPYVSRGDYRCRGREVIKTRLYRYDHGGRGVHARPKEQTGFHARPNERKNRFGPRARDPILITRGGPF